MQHIHVMVKTNICSLVCVQGDRSAEDMDTMELPQSVA